MQELNKELLIYLNSFLNYQIVEKITLIFADIPIFFLPIFLIVTWLYYTFSPKYRSDEDQKKSNLKEKTIKKKKNLLFIFYSCVIAIAINLVIQNLVKIDRPETALQWAWKLILEHIPDASFPSDHAAVSIAFLVSLFFTKYTKIWLLFLVPMILMNISRVILWVHWPFDTIAGIIIWIISAIISFKFLKWNKYIDKFNNFALKVAGIFKL